MKVIIIEDEIDARKVLSYLIKRLFPEIIIAGETGSVSQAKKLIVFHQPDLIFLDVQLEDGDGFDLLKQCAVENFYTIFTTAYSDFAINAIKYSAVDYLLKPINPEELKTAINKVQEKISNALDIKKLKIEVENKQGLQEKKITIKTSEQTFVIPIKEIVRLEADGAYTTIVTTKTTIIVSKNIKYYQNVLQDENFLRPHQSHLVNKDYILEFDNKGNLLLSNNDIIPVAFRKKAMIRKMLKNNF
jgi:two-component system LytT family response regulator